MTKHIASRPREIVNCVGAYLQEGDMEGIVSMFHPDCHVYFLPDQPPSIGLAGVRQVFEGFIDIRPEIQSDVIGEVIIGNIALLCAEWRVVAPDGSVMAEGRSTEVAKKLKNGGWRYLIDCPYGPPRL